MSPSATGWPGDRGGHVWPKDREVVADDGARIRYTVEGADDGPWMVLCSGYMCPDNFWMYAAPRWMETHRVIVLNYRGVGASTDPRPPGYRALNVSAADYTVERFAGDVAAVLAAEGATEVAVVGHSMGVQVALQVWRTVPDRVAGLALVTGPYASPLHTFYGSKLGVALFPFASLGLTLAPRRVQRIVGLTLRSPIALPLARLIKALGPETPLEGMQPYFDHFDRVDPMVALKIAKGMHRFDAGPWLDEVDVPTLVVVGSEDRFSPPALGRAMVQVMPDAELVEIPGGTHGALIEFPERIADAVAAFLRRRVGPEAEGSPGGGPEVAWPSSATPTKGVTSSPEQA
ncbi:MAG: alpha/beta hydrolase [Actinobacteria bacterium]|nr:alpha/beta hydrolase [Actinomycetota bacterium]